MCESAWINSPDIFGEMAGGWMIGTMHENRGGIVVYRYVWMSSEGPGDAKGRTATAGEAVNDQVLHDRWIRGVRRWRGE